MSKYQFSTLYEKAQALLSDMANHALATLSSYDYAISNYTVIANDGTAVLVEVGVTSNWDFVYSMTAPDGFYSSDKLEHAAGRLALGLS